MCNKSGYIIKIFWILTWQQKVNGNIWTIQACLNKPCCLAVLLPWWPAAQMPCCPDALLPGCRAALLTISSAKERAKKWTINRSKSMIFSNFSSEISRITLRFTAILGTYLSLSLVLGPRGKRSSVPRLRLRLFLLNVGKEDLKFE